MRIIIDSLIGVMLIAVVAGALHLYSGRQQSAREIEVVRGALQQLQEQAAYHTAVESAVAGRDTLLVHLHPQWFGEDLPRNVLLDAGHPWIDLAPPGDLGQHPPDPVATGQGQAGFWYNPTTGVFRARVKPASSEAQTLALYNEVNGTALASFEELPDPSRAPIAHELGKTPATLYASMANKTWSQPAPKDELASDLIAPVSPPDALAAEASNIPAALGPDALGPADRAGSSHESSIGTDRQGEAVPTVEVLPAVPEKRPTLKKE